MRKDTQDGRPIPGTEGTLTGEQQAAMLGLDKTRPKPAPLPPTPAQQRRKMSNEWADDLTPPDYERSVVSDPEQVAQVMGARPEDFDAVPLGSAPEGQPIPQPSIRPKVKRHTDDGPPPSTSTPEQDAATRAKLAEDFRAHAKKIAEIAESAKGSGDPDREAKAAAEVAATRQLGEQLRARGVL